MPLFEPQSLSWDTLPGFSIRSTEPMKISTDWPSASSWILSSTAILTVPSTPIQCSDQWLWLCRLRAAPRLTKMCFTWNWPRVASISNPPQGQWTFGDTSVYWIPFSFNLVTTYLTSWTQSLRATRAASSMVVATKNYDNQFPWYFGLYPFSCDLVLALPTQHSNRLILIN